MITREFNLYLHAGHSIPLVINVNQYDRGETWVFTLFNSDGTQYIPSSGAIVGIKSDNLGIINAGAVDGLGRVLIDETEQMTASVGKAVFELVIDDGTHGTANFVVLVEPKPGDNADLSESDISMIEQAIEAASTIKPYGSPLVASTVAGMTDHEKVYVYVGSETGYTSGNWYYWDGSAWTSGGVYNSVAVQTDTTLTLSGVAADSKKVGDEISDLKSEIDQFEAIPYAIKQAMKNMFAHAIYKDYDASNDVSAFNSWANTLVVTSISAVFTQGDNLIFSIDSIDSLREYLTVTANYDNGTSGEVTTYTLIGDMTGGENTFTVTYNDKTATFTANITEAIDVTPALSSFTANAKCAVSVNSATNSIRVYTTSNTSYAGAFVNALTLKEGYTYKVSADAEIAKGKAKLAIVNSSTNQSMGGAPTLGALDSSGHLENSFIPSTATSWGTGGQVKLFCVWATTEAGDVTFSNIKIIEYLAEVD